MWIKTFYFRMRVTLILWSINWNLKSCQFTNLLLIFSLFTKIIVVKKQAMVFISQNFICFFLLKWIIIKNIETLILIIIIIRFILINNKLALIDLLRQIVYCRAIIIVLLLKQHILFLQNLSFLKYVLINQMRLLSLV